MAGGLYVGGVLHPHASPHSKTISRSDQARLWFKRIEYFIGAQAEVENMRGAILQTGRFAKSVTGIAQASFDQCKVCFVRSPAGKLLAVECFRDKLQFLASEIAPELNKPFPRRRGICRIHEHDVAHANGAQLRVNEFEGNSFQGVELVRL